MAERGGGIACVSDGGLSCDLDSWLDTELLGVEFVDDEASELVRVREGVRVFRESGRLRETFRSLPYGDGWFCID